MPSETTYRIYINNRPHDISRAPLPAAQVAAMAGVPLDNVVIELETPAGLKEVALDGTLAAADGLSFIVTRSEEHTSELQSLMRNSYAVFCLQQKKKKRKTQ